MVAARRTKGAPQAGHGRLCRAIHPRERLRWGAGGLAIYAACYLLWIRWALPHWSAFAGNARCIDVWGVPGINVLFYALFLGMPLMMALLTAIFIGRRGLRVLRDGQSPYQGEKVFRRTRIMRGRSARVTGWAQLLAPLWFVAIALWGATAAHAPIASIEPADTSECEARRY